jgi:hypothetical protein
LASNGDAPPREGSLADKENMMGRPPVLKWAVRGAWRGSARLMMACVVGGQGGNC